MDSEFNIRISLLIDKDFIITKESEGQFNVCKLRELRIVTGERDISEFVSAITIKFNMV